jgi:hypothetical protein
MTAAYPHGENPTPSGEPPSPAAPGTGPAAVSGTGPAPAPASGPPIAPGSGRPAPPASGPGAGPGRSPAAWPPGAFQAPGVRPSGPPRSDTGTWVAGLVLVAIGGLLLLGRWVPDAGEYVVLAIGLVLLVVFFATSEYGFLVPGGIISGIGAGIPLATAYEGQLGGGLFLIAMAVGFLLIWIVGLLFRVREHHWWPLVPGLILGTLGASLTAGERGRGIADAIAAGWPALLVVAGVLMLIGAFRRRAARPPGA